MPIYRHRSLFTITGEIGRNLPFTVGCLRVVGLQCTLSLVWLGNKGIPYARHMCQILPDTHSAPYALVNRQHH